MQRFHISSTAHRTDDALDLLLRHDWPGNIRELQNEIRRAGALSRGVIDADVLSREVRDSASQSKPAGTRSGEAGSMSDSSVATAGLLRGIGGGRSG